MASSLLRRATVDHFFDVISLIVPAGGNAEKNLTIFRRRSVDLDACVRCNNSLKWGPEVLNI